MCYSLYIGSNAPLNFDQVAQGSPRMCLVPTHNVPTALADKKHVGLLALCSEGKVFCSCDIQQNSLPWEPQEEDSKTVEMYDRLRSEISCQVENGAEPLVLVVWDGCETEEPDLIWRAAPRHLRAESCLIGCGWLLPGGIPSFRTLIRIDPRREVPIHDVINVS